MNRFVNVKNMEKAAGVFLIAAFVCLLWLPTLDAFFNLDKAPQPNEKREPAKFPKFHSSLSGLRDFLSGLDSYYADHFGFRKRLIRWEHKWKRQLFNESTISDVMIGRDGWLFFAGDQMIADCRATRPFAQKDLKAWQDLLESRRDWLAKRGIAYIFVVPPDKHSIYPEYLPEWMVRVGKETRLDQFMAHMKANSTVPVLDLRPPLIAAKKTSQTYLFTDTHWNFYGGFVAYQSLIEAISTQLPQLKALSLTAFKLDWKSQKGGDLAGMLGQEETMLEKGFVTLVPDPPLNELVLSPITNFTKTKWMKGAEPVYTELNNQTGKAIVFRDSFAGSWAPYLGHNFNKVFYIWQHHWDAAFIDSEKPVVVIDEILERFLNKENPAELQKKEALPR